MKTESKPHRARAIVIGASISGLLAARVLSDFYEEVIVLERDELTDTPEQRRGVPHGRHAHGLLAGGQAVIERLFPGISRELINDGAISVDPLRDGTWFFEGGGLCKNPTGYAGVLASRPFLETKIRERVRRTKKIKFVTGETVRFLIPMENSGRLRGVVTDDRTIEADIVVDASGRGSKSSQWLESLGFESAREEKVGVELVYTTRIFRANREAKRDDAFVVIAPTPKEKRGGVIALQEGDRWICTLFGHFGNVAPDALYGFHEYARSLPSPLIYELIRKSEAIGDAVRFRYPASTRRRYEELKNFPEGYLVFGDAMCSFNPIYGQGMSVAALQSEALSEALHQGDHDLAQRFFKKAAKVIDNPWNLAVGADMRMPETTGPRSAKVNVINWYIARLHQQAHTDPVASVAFTRVAQLLDPPSALMRPSIIARVLAGALLRRMNRSPETNGQMLGTVKTAQRLPSDGF